ncbi:hypothetical protein [Polyangium aurulentum]|uniref:hypothetical protein n=1 Tax=Polyangium aurulentum TaxID=2567896 RepID=UPI0010AEC0D7|nr:hypothetical protein [Polyangium aurulentum]UQA63386.1 hypothetical protein E8A73_024120 [Polyangium aurulentum]
MTASRKLRRASGLLTLALAAAFAASCGGSAARTETPKKGDAPMRVLADPVNGAQMLEADASRAKAAGAGPLRVIKADFLSEGDRLGAFVEIPEDECMLAIARGSPSIGDIDLFAYEDDGSSFAVDEAPDARPAVLICPPHPRRLYVTARVMAGGGLISVGAQSVPKAQLAAIEQVVGARGRSGGETGRLEAWPGLEAKLIARRAALGGRWEDVRRAALPVAPRAATRLTVPVEAGRCIDVLASPSEEVASIEVLAEDAAGRIVARGKDRGRDKALVLCSATSMELTVAIRPRASQGIVAVVASRSAPGAAASIDPAARVEHVTETRELAEARAALERDLAGKGYGAPKALATGTAKVGSRAGTSVDLPAGCSRLDVIAGKPLADVGATLWDDRGGLLADGRGGAGATLFACGPGGPARVDVEALARPGPFAIELRKDRAAPDALVKHPLAASRLLAALDVSGERADASMAARAEVLALDASARATLPLDVPAKSCASVIATLDRNGSGLDLRLADASTGEAPIVRGRFLVSDRLCASVTPVKGTAELRLLSGKAEALVLVRIAPL